MLSPLRELDKLRQTGIVGVIFFVDIQLTCSMAGCGAIFLKAS